jgi:hypothetical protein
MSAVTLRNPDDALIAGDADSLIAHKYVLLAGEKVVRGELMAVLTSGGKAVASTTGGSDGSQTPFGICAVDADATGDSPDVDSQVLIYVAGSFGERALTLGAGHTIDSIREGLRSKGIILETPLKRFP